MAAQWSSLINSPGFSSSKVFDAVQYTHGWLLTRPAEDGNLNEREGFMLDHVFITVKDLNRSIAFYEAALKPLGIMHAVDYDGKDGPEGHPDLKGFGRDGRVFFWLRQGHADAKAAHFGFVAKNKAKVNAFYKAAMAAGATDNGKPGARLYYDPRYYAANVFDPDGYSLEAVYKSWQHRQ